MQPFAKKSMRFFVICLSLPDWMPLKPGNKALALGGKWFAGFKEL
jgi:hypothetical protein